MLKNNDFVEIEYIGKTKDGTIFDTNIKEEAEKINLKIESKPLIVCIGQNMILSSIDKFLIGKDIGTYDLSLEPEQAFGKRNKNLVRIFPISIFKKQKLNPVPGAIFYFDNLIGKITTVSGGRVIVDFNNPLAGKQVEYKIFVKRKITDINEKVKSLLFFYTKKEFPFKIQDKKLIINSNEKILSKLKDKFKQILDLELIIDEKSNQ